MRHHIIAVLFCIAALSSTSQAGVPGTVTVQGRLTDAAGTPLTAGVKSFEFRIFSDTTGGVQVWPAGGIAENQSITSATEGLWIGLIGAVNPLTEQVFADPDTWLEIKVEGTTLPRTKLVTGPYAFRVATVDGASGGNITKKVSIGPGHTNTGADAFVAGELNVVAGDQAVVSGGKTNLASGKRSVVGGGGSNEATGDFATIAGGDNNTADTFSAAIGGGENNLASNYAAVVAGGNSNAATGDHAAVLGGVVNTASGGFSAVGAGFDNDASGLLSVVAGGNHNFARGSYSFVGGGGGSLDFTGIAADSNSALGEHSVIIGGHGHRATGDKSFIGGGHNNVVSDTGAVIVGGRKNLASGRWSAIGGGTGDTASGDFSVAAGGQNNRATGNHSFVGGGGGASSIEGNRATGLGSTIGGGNLNVAQGDRSVVTGGSQNEAKTPSAVICGGSDNAVTGSFGGGFIGGGSSNVVADGFNGAIAGGLANEVTDDYSGILGGRSNSVSSDYSAILGGDSNVVIGFWGAIGGGHFNEVTAGSYATVPGGFRNRANGTASFAAGNRAKAMHDGTFVWADNTNADFSTSNSKQFLIRATNGVGIGTNDPDGALEVRGGDTYLDADLGVGTETPEAPLHVHKGSAGAVTANSNSVAVFENSTSGWINMIGPDDAERGLLFTEPSNTVAGAIVFDQGGGGDDIGFRTGGNVTRMTLDASGNLTVTGCVDGNNTACSSDERFKRDIATVGDPLSTIQHLRGVTYKWRVSEFPDRGFEEDKQYGLIAQEVQQVLPELVRQRDDGYLSVEYTALIPLLIEGMKEQQRLIERQIERIANLEKKLEQ